MFVQNSMTTVNGNHAIASINIQKTFGTYCENVIKKKTANNAFSVYNLKF